MCAECPSATLFDLGDGDSMCAESPSASQLDQRDEAFFRARTEQENQALINEWSQYAHPRAREYFQSEGGMMDVLMQLAMGIDRDSDPVLGPDDQCVRWYGDVANDGQQAVVSIGKPAETKYVIYVNRVLAFIFATDDSFEQLKRLPNEPLKMACSDQLCVHLAHISLAVDINGQGDGNSDNMEQKDKRNADKSKRPSSKPKSVKTSFLARTEQENQALINEWSKYVHPRAREYFQSEGDMMDALMQLAMGIDRDSDPVLGPSSQCVRWYGDVTKDVQQAVVRVMRPGETTRTATYVTRFLAFIFASDESFEQMKKLLKDPSKMSCCDQLCVHLAHISLAVAPL
jgi:hypothetical protein